MNNYKYSVGARFESKSGGEFEIIEIIDSNRIKIKFLDEFQFEKIVDKNSIRKNSVKNPYKPTIFGIGYFGVGKYRAKYGAAAKGFRNTVEYNTWQNMLQRCYYDKYINRVEGTTCYDTVAVCSDWHNFQNFAEWYYSKAKIFEGKILGRLHVDKDIISKGTSKVYSPETCCLIPQEINAFFIGQNKGKSRNLPLNIVKSSNGYRILRLHNLIINKEFKSLQEAVSFRDDVKQKCLNKLIIKYFDALEDRVIDALVNYYGSEKSKKSPPVLKISVG